MDNFAYFFVFYPKTKKEDANDIEFVIPENKEYQPECIFFEFIENIIKSILFFVIIHSLIISILILDIFFFYLLNFL